MKKQLDEKNISISVTFGDFGFSCTGTPEEVTKQRNYIFNKFFKKDDKEKEHKKGEELKKIKEFYAPLD